MLDELVLHSATRAQLDGLIANPVHAILFSAPRGAGTTALAEHLAATYLGLASTKKLLSDQHFLKVMPDEKNTISIEKIRELKHFLVRKTAGERTIRRILLIEHAEAMPVEAQNALLKTLEEPPADTVILMTTSAEQTIPPTVLSRSRIVRVVRPLKVELRDFFISAGASEVAVEQALAMSENLPSLTTALLEQNQTHPLIVAIEQAKDILRATTFERLCMMDTLAKERAGTESLLEGCRRICRVALHKAAKASDTTLVRGWEKRLRLVHEAEAALQANANLKLVMTRFCLYL